MKPDVGGLMLKLISDWAVSAAALLVASGAIYRYAIRPFTRTIREMQAGIHWVQEQMQNNGGSTFLDKFDVMQAQIDELVQSKNETLRIVAEIRSRLEP